MDFKVNHLKAVLEAISAIPPATKDRIVNEILTILEDTEVRRGYFVVFLSRDEVNSLESSKLLIKKWQKELVWIGLFVTTNSSIPQIGLFVEYEKAKTNETR